MAAPTTTAPVEALLLDWDGTLVDARQRVLAAFRSATAAVTGTPFPATDAEEAVALTTAIAEVFAVIAPGRVAELVRAYGDAYALGDAPVTLLPGAAELVAGARERGIPVALVTAKATDSLACDRRIVGAEAWFDLVVTADGPWPPKPDPAGILHCLAELGVAPARALYLGDAASDVVAARAAGVRPVVALYGFDPARALAAGPDGGVSSSLDVLPLLDGAAPPATTVPPQGASR